MAVVLQRNKQILREHAGTCEISVGETKETVNLSTTLHRTPVVEFEDGTLVYWTWEELVHQAIKLKNSQAAATDYEQLKH